MASSSTLYQLPITGMSTSPTSAQFSNPIPTATSDATNHVTQASVASSGQNRDPQRLISERWWYETRDEIVHSGYKLHFRYKFYWQPSRLKWGRRLLTSEGDEDEDEYPSGVIMDAIRIQDGLPVILKKVLRLPVESSYDSEVSESELTINQYFSSREFARRSDNHCVPMLDVVELQHYGSHQLMVFPHLLPFHRSRIRTLEEFNIFITQICEGIQFMHQRDIAYGNCTTGHIMFDPFGRCPNDWSNPSQINRGRNLMGRVERRLTRTQDQPRYYLADLSSSRQFTRRNAPGRCLRGSNSSSPEGRVDGLNDAFRMDIYCLGDLVRENFVQKYHGFEFVRDLVEEMTDANPEQRPTIEQVVERLTLASRSLSEVDLRSTFVLKDPGLTRTTRLFHTLLHNLQRRSSTVIP